MLANVATFALEGIDTHEVTVEVDLRRGLPAFTVVGLPDAAVREARERVRAALLNSELEFPLQRVTVNLAPASIRKAGPSFDLAMAVAILAASGQVPADTLQTYAVCGELSLGGVLRAVRGSLAVALGARDGGYRHLIVPRPNAGEAALVEDIDVLGIDNLRELVRLLRGEWRPDPPVMRERGRQRAAGDLAEVRGQTLAKRALEIAAAGGHNVLMVGPPGAGKTMLARRLPGILPPPDFHEAVEITRIHSIAGLSDGRLATERPFRAPHHTISPSGLVGGGTRPRAGEITLAHRGVLFLDELGEFSRLALEAMRQPLESGRIEVMRGQRFSSFPALTMLVGASNGCPCGRPPADCRCTQIDRDRYARRLSAPLLDRIDILCELSLPTATDLDSNAPPAESSSVVRARVVAARDRQRDRLRESSARSNAEMDGPLTRRYVPVRGEARARLASARRLDDLSARAHDRVLRVARTIADIDGRERVNAADVDEALSYRLSDPLAIAA